MCTHWRSPVYHHRFGKLCVLHFSLVFILSSVSRPNVILLEGASSVDNFPGKFLCFLPGFFHEKCCLDHICDEELTCEE